jgi:hypothetical protein
MKNAITAVLLLVFTIVAALLAPAANAADVQVGVYIINLGKFDVASGSFTADFYLSLKCPDCAKEDGKVTTLIPFNGFEFMNGRAATMDKIIDEPTEKFYRIQANLQSPVDLKDYPFDSQEMQIILEDKTQTTEALNYVPDLEQTGMDDVPGFTGWDLLGYNASVREHEYKVYDETYSQYVFRMPINRIASNAFLKTFLPVCFIMLIVLFSFLLDPDKITTRLGMVSSALVASVMFHVSIANQLPPVGYLTFADKFMVLTYFVLLASFIINIAMIEMLEQKKEKLVHSIHRATEWTMFIVVPLIYLLLFWLF